MECRCRCVLIASVTCVLSLVICSPHALPAATSPSLSLLVVWPPENGSVDGEQVRVGGRTAPDAKVTVNGKALRVFPSGAFAGTCPLDVGWNDLTFRASRGEKSLTESRRVRRLTPLRTLPPTPIRFDPNYDGQPSEAMEVRPGDTVSIRVKGSPGCKAMFRIGGGETRHPLYPTTRYDAAGFYEGAYLIKSTDRFVDARITCYLYKKGESKPAAEMRVPGRVTVNTSAFPDVALAREDYVQLRAEPQHGAPVLAAREGTYLRIDGRVGSWLRVTLAPSLHAWVQRDVVQMSANEPPLRRGTVRNLSVIEQEGATVVRIPLGLRVPFRITEKPHSAAIELNLFDVENNLNWITDRTPHGLVSAIAALPSADGCCRFDITLREGGILGYRGYYEGSDLCVALRHPLKPPADTARPLAGHTILLDAGHGGPSKGTLGSTGIEEKVVNADLCRILSRVLEARGARVRLTRPDDEEVSLAGRCRQAEEDGDLLVSIHNNSIDLSGDPLAARGVGAFYHHPHAREVAQAIYQRMLTVEPGPDPYGLVAADLWIPREITAMPSVLLECLFLSNPEDEMLLMDKKFCERYMGKVADGIADWLRSAGK